MGLVCLQTHSVHDFLVGAEVASVAGGTSGIEVLMERDFLLVTVGREQGEVVLVIANDGLDVGISGPGLLEPALEGGEATLDSGGESTTQGLLDTLRGVLLHVVEGKRGELSSHDNLLEVGDLEHGFFHLDSTFSKLLFCCAIHIE